MLKRVILMRRVLLVIGIILTLISLGLVLKGSLGVKPNESLENLLANNKPMLIKEARKLGMEFPDQLNKNEVKKEMKRLGLNTEKSSSSLKPKLKEEQKGFVILKIKPGTTANQVANDLYQMNLIKDKAALLKLFDSFGVTNKILAGEYKFKRSTSLENVLLTIIR